ncbi:MAG: sugar system component [Actinomycetota bacterium]|nr:sugar system component [Actinomycetota bacterium]
MTEESTEENVVKTLHVLSPVPGVCTPLGRVPDSVFAQGLVGPGVAVAPLPEPIDAVAPVDGRLVKLHSHAFVIRTPCGRGVLVHLGIDTVKLNGEGFVPHVAQGEEVKAGQAIISWDPAAVAAGGRDPICPVVVLDTPAELVRNITTEGTEIASGSPLFTVGPEN